MTHKPQNTLLRAFTSKHSDGIIIEANKQETEKYKWLNIDFFKW
ncbi:hypothetical protein COPEUT_02848 [Coprococcus eutactus ATCC 27759]|nr:hypothetical protein COPEUT_02848 [Coprococcus eutactus ATCC 27759]